MYVLSCLYIICCTHRRSLGQYKFTVRNRAAPEGSIAKGYIAAELLTFCSRYLVNTPTFHNRPLRNPEESRGAVTSVNLDGNTLIQVHRYILFNSDEFLPFRT
jgi:hypothetical protein